jgi:hypothetical protein
VPINDDQFCVHQESPSILSGSLRLTVIYFNICHANILAGCWNMLNDFPVSANKSGPRGS